MWWAILGAGLGCYLLKLAGLSVPAGVLARPRVARMATLLPVALLAGLVAVQVLAAPDDGRLVVDARLAGLAAAIALLLVRAPFLIVVLGAATLTALLRLL